MQKLKDILLLAIGEFSAICMKDNPKWIFPSEEAIEIAEKHSKVELESRSKLDLAVKALTYYAGMQAICRHDDSSWCDHCPDGGRTARKALLKILDQQEELKP
jgi:hypothetical protein